MERLGKISGVNSQWQAEKSTEANDGQSKVNAERRTGKANSNGFGVEWVGKRGVEGVGAWQASCKLKPELERSLAAY